MNDWWARKLAQPQPQPVQAQPPQYAARPVPQPPSRPAAAPSLPLKEDVCPGCYGTNYVAPPGSERKRCFDCGYPIQQAGSGVGSTHSDTPSKQATQVPTGGYRPTQIVGRVE